MRQLIAIGTPVVVTILVGVALALLIARSALPSTPPSSAGSPGRVFVGAGDIAECPTQDDEATAAILDDIIAEEPDAVVFTTGDNAYRDGTYAEFVECYGPSWGRFRDRTYPAVGNHEFRQARASGYHEYWGDRGGPFDLYYYSFEVDDWHVVVVNSACNRVGCEPGSPDGEQYEWLEADLEESGARCTIAIWHHPRWSSGRYDNDPATHALWELLYEQGAEMVLNGHEHLYERFEPMGPEGMVDEERGIRQFTVGTGGGNLRGFEDVKDTSAARGSEHGVLKLTLRDGRYDWEFVAVEGGTFTDTGSDTCH